MEAFKLESLRATHGNNPTHLSNGKGTTYTNSSTDSRATLYRGHHTLLASSYLQEENKHQELTQKETTSTNGYANHHLPSEL